MTIAYDTQVHSGFSRTLAGPAHPSRQVRTIHAAAVGGEAARVGQPVTVLTRRGRFVVGVLVSIAIAVGIILLGSTVAATQDTASVSTHSVVVQPGDTLWALASTANPGGDIRKTVDEIIRLNALEAGMSLPAGVTIAVPVYE